MLYAFTMDVGTAMEFYKRVAERNAVTEEERWKILMELSDEGRMTGVTATERSKEKYIEDLSKNFKVADTTAMKRVPDATLDACWCVDSDTGEELLIDVKAGRILARRVDGKIVSNDGEAYEAE